MPARIVGGEASRLNRRGAFGAFHRLEQVRVTGAAHGEAGAIRQDRQAAVFAVGFDARHTLQADDHRAVDAQSAWHRVALDFRDRLRFQIALAAGMQGDVIVLRLDVIELVEGDDVDTRAIAHHDAVHALLGGARRRDAMQGTFIGVLMSATLPARLGEPSRALIVARRLGRARETLPIVLGTMVSQTLLNLLALTILGGVTLSSVSVLDGHDRPLLLIALAPVAALVLTLLAPILIPSAALSRSRRLQALLVGLRGVLLRLRDGLRVFRRPRSAAVAAVAQLGAWALQWLACWLLLIALGLDSHAGLAAAAAVLFAVNVTAVIPATPANVGVFQAACVAVLAGAYHVSTPDAIAYGIVLQVVEVATALIMGMPALVNEGLSWRDVRLRALHAAPVKLGPLPADGASGLAPAEL